MITIIVLYIILGIIAFIVILLHFSVRVKLCAQSGEKPMVEVKWLFLTIYPRKPKKEKKRKKKEDRDQAKAEYTEAEIEELIRQAEEDDEQSHELEKAKEMEAKEDTEADQTKNIEEIEATDEASQKLDRKAKKERKKKEKAEKAQTEEAVGDEESEGGLAKVKRYVNMVKPYVPMAWKAFKKILKTIRFTKLDIRLVTGKEDAYEAAMAYGKLNAAVYNGVATVGRIFTVHAKSVKVDCRFNEKAFEYDVGTTVMVRPSTLIAIVFCVGVNFLRIFIPQKIRSWRERRRQKRSIKKMKKYNETELLTNE